MIIVGLGNPGAEYSSTHHNIGFMALDKVAAFYGATFKKSTRFNGEVANVRVNDKKVYLLKPLTYMNNSGESVGKLSRHYKIDSKDILVIHDDMDLPLGKIRIRKNGSSGGHNGIKSIIAHLGSEEFNRIRFGIDHASGSHDDVIDYVLAPFTKREHETIDPILENFPTIIDDYIKNGIDYCMNHHNNKEVK